MPTLQSDERARQRAYLDSLSLDELYALQRKVSAPVPPAEQIKTAASNVLAGAGEIPAGIVDFVGIVAGAAEDGDAHRYANAIRDWFRTIIPASERAGRSSPFWLETVPQALGSGLGFLVPGAAVGGAAKALGAGARAVTALNYATPAVLGAMSQGSAEYYDAEAGGATEGEKWAAFAIGTAVGTTEAVPIGEMLNRINRGTNGALRRMLVEGLEEATQEFGQQTVSNLVAQNTYDEDRELMAGAIEGGSAGFLTGMFLSALASGAGRLGSRGEAEGGEQGPQADQAPQAGPDPEGAASVQAQMRALGEGRVPGVWLPGGSAEPESLPEGVQTAEVDGGTLMYRDEATLQAAQAGRMGEALGYGIAEKPSLEDASKVVVARDSSGAIVRGVVVPDAVPQEVLDAAQTAAGEGGDVEVMSLERSREALLERAGERVTDARVQEADRLAVPRLFGEGVRPVEAPRDARDIVGWAQRRGRRLVFVEAATGDALSRSGALYDRTGTIFLDANAGTRERLWGLAVHEALHGLRGSEGAAGAAWTDLAESLQREAPDLVRSFGDEYARSYEQEFGRALPDNLRLEESVSTLAENLGGLIQFALENPARLQGLAQESRTLFDRIVDVLLDLLNTLPGVNLERSRVRRLREVVRGAGVSERFTPEQARDAVLAVMEALDTTLGAAPPPQFRFIAEKSVGRPELPAPRAEGVVEAGPEGTTAKARAAELRKAPAKDSTEARAQLREARRQEAKVPKPPRPEATRRKEPTRAESAIAAYEEGEDVRFALAPDPEQGHIDLSRGVLDSAGKFLGRNFRSRGDLPQATFDAKITRDSWVRAQLETLRQVRTDTERAIKAYLGKPARKMTEAEARELDKALRDPAARQKLPPALREALQAARDHLKALSHRMIESGVVEGPLAEKVAANSEFYLTRQYRAHLDPTWAKKVPADVRNRWKALLRAERQFAGYTDAQMELELDRMLYNDKAEEKEALGPIAAIAKGKLGSKDLSILKRRKLDNMPELRAFLGEYQDPIVNYTLSVAKMANLIGNHDFLKRVRAEGLGTFLWESDDPKAPAEAKARIAADESSVMSPLNGLFTYPEVQRAFVEFEKSETMPSWLRLWVRVNGLAKAGKTIGSLMTVVRNYYGNGGFMVANGHWRIWELPKATRTAMLRAFDKLDEPGQRAYVQHLVELGVIGEGTAAGEVNDMLRDANAAPSMTDFMDGALKRFGKAVAGRATDLYEAGDAAFKIMAFENEKARYRKAKPEWSERQLEEHVAAIVRNTYPTYSLVPRAIRALRRVPLVGTFVSFPAEVVRTMKNTLGLIRTEMADPDLRGIGAQRLVGTMGAMIGPAVALAAARMMAGIDDDEDNWARELLAPWQRNSEILWLGKDDDGNRRYVDVSYSDPYHYFKEPLIALARGESLDDAIAEGLASMLEPFASEEIFTQAVVDIRRNTTTTGGQVYNPEGSTLEQARSITYHLWKAMQPGTVTSVGRILEGARGEQPLYGPKYDPWNETVKTLSGVDRRILDLQQALDFRASEYQSAMTKATGLLTAVARRRGRVSDAEIRDAYAEMEQARARIWDKAYRSTAAAIALGLDARKAEAALRASMSADNARNLVRGRYEPYSPSSSFLRTYITGSPPDQVREYERRRRLIRQLAVQSKRDALKEAVGAR